MDLLHDSDICSHTDGILNLTNPDDARDILYDATDRFLLIVVVPIISMIGIVGNAAFLFMAMSVHDLNYVTIFLSNLAVCDVLFLISVNVWFILTILNTPVNTEFPVHSVFGCAVSVISVNWWYYTSLGLISLITVERYMAICHPVKHLNIKGRARTLKLLAAVWISALIITLTQIPQNVKFTTSCVLWPQQEEFEELPRTINDCEPLSVGADIYGSSLILVSLILTMVINIALCIRIIQKLQKITRGSTANQTGNSITRTLIINGVIFFICQLPYRMWILDDVLDLTETVDLIAFEHESLVLTVARGFLILNSIVNPFLYVFTCRHYRQAMGKAFFTNRCIKKPFPRHEISEGNMVSRGVSSFDSSL